MIIKGNKVDLRSTTIADQEPSWRMLARSDIILNDRNVFPERTPCTWQEYQDDFKAHFFDGKTPLLGRSFAIQLDGNTIGYLNHNDIRFDQSATELDIWLCCESICGKGYGTEALRLLSDYIRNAYGIIYAVIQPSARNKRAIRSYEKAGFVRLSLTTEEAYSRFGMTPDSCDNVHMVKDMQENA